MQNGGLALTPELLDLGAEAADVLLMVGQRAAGEGIRLEFTEPEQPCPVMADKNRLRQVFLNVLDNALKYSPAGGTIRVGLLRQDGFAVLEVQDEGPGIEPEDLAHIKTKFYKGRGAVRGSGIGLAVVDEIMTAHGGSLEIESAPGAGLSLIHIFCKRPTDQMMAFSLGFAGGVMLTVSLSDMLPHAVGDYGAVMTNFRAVSAAISLFLLGMLIAWLLQHCLPEPKTERLAKPGDGRDARQLALAAKSAIITTAVIVMHNLPEGCLLYTSRCV